MTPTRLSLTPEAERARVAALEATGLLDTPPELAFDDLARLAAHICGTPIALVSLVDTDRQWFKARVGLDASGTPREHAFCSHAIHEPDLFVVADAAADTRFATNPLVTGEPRIRFYAGAPLVTDEGHALGTLCVIDRVPRTLAPEQLEALRALRRQVVDQIDRRQQLARLQDAYRALGELDRMKSGFLQDINHELRTPLTAVRGALHALDRNDATLTAATRAELLDVALRNTERLARLVDDMLRHHG